MRTSRDKARVHATRAYYCSCGAMVHGNGGRSGHFGPSWSRREGHREINRERWLAEQQKSDVNP